MDEQGVIDVLQERGYSNVVNLGNNFYTAYDNNDDLVYFRHQRADNRILVYSYTEVIFY